MFIETINTVEFIFINMLFLFVSAHFIGDYVFQDDNIAIGKNMFINDGKHMNVNWYYWMSAHCCMHGMLIYLISGIFILFILEFILHFIIDLLKCAGTINLHTDQILHVVCKIFYTLFIIFNCV